MDSKRTKYAASYLLYNILWSFLLIVLVFRLQPLFLICFILCHQLPTHVLCWEGYF